MRLCKHFVATEKYLFAILGYYFLETRGKHFLSSFVEFIHKSTILKKFIRQGQFLFALFICLIVFTFSVPRTRFNIFLIIIFHEKVVPKCHKKSSKTVPFAKEHNKNNSFWICCKKSFSYFILIGWFWNSNRKMMNSARLQASEIPTFFVFHVYFRAKNKLVHLSSYLF